MLTVTGPCAHLHFNVPPANEADPFFTPPSTAGWIEMAMRPPVELVLRECSEGVYEARGNAGCQCAQLTCSIAASSSALNASCRTAATFSRNCSTLLAPT